MWNKGRAGIALVGFMGAGKTSVAQELARALQIPLYSSDSEILSHSLRGSISELFELDGEATFRDLETEALISASVPGSKVLDPGGGIVERPTNRELLRNHWHTIFLETAFETVIQRLEGDESRPLWRNREAARELFERRQPLYRAVSALTITTDTRSIDDVVDAIVKELKAELTGVRNGL